MAEDKRVGSSGGDGPETAAGILSRLRGRDLWAVILIASLSGGNVGLWTKAPDRWTGENQKQYMKEQRELNAKQDAWTENLEKRVEELEVAQGKDDIHRTEAATGYKRIRQCEAAVSALRSRTDHNMEDIRELRDRVGR